MYVNVIRWRWWHLHTWISKLCLGNMMIFELLIVLPFIFLGNFNVIVCFGARLIKIKDLWTQAWIICCLVAQNPKRASTICFIILVDCLVPTQKVLQFFNATVTLQQRVELQLRTVCGTNSVIAIKYNEFSISLSLNQRQDQGLQPLGDHLQSSEWLWW